MRRPLIPGQTKRTSRGPLLLLALVVTCVVLVEQSCVGVRRSMEEDAATNLWLGYTRNPLDAPIGLVSSVDVPNANGVVLASYFLSRLPDLRTTSAFLGLLQAAAIGWLCWLITGDALLFLAILGPLWSCITLRGISVELHNGWLLAPLNCLFFCAVILYLRRPSLWIVPAAITLALMAASFYLAGATNSIGFLLVLAILLVVRPPRSGWHTFLAPLLVAGIVLGLSLWLTWLPYFQAVGLDEILRSREPFQVGHLKRLLLAAQSVLQSPYWSLAQFGTDLAAHPAQLNRNILSAATWSGFRALTAAGLVQGTVCYAAVLGMLIAKRTQAAERHVRPRVEQHTAATALLLMAIFTVGCYAAAPLIGGPAWVNNERLDQVTQFLPLVLLIWFRTPFLLGSETELGRIVRGFTYVSSTVYTVLALVIGGLAVSENLSYRGALLPEGDVPVSHKLMAVDFMAADWRSRSTNPEIPVDYDLGGGYFDWVPEFGGRYKRWYPAPYTLGRALDYQLWRGYGLWNSNEGKQLRPVGQGRYLVSYASLPAPVVEGHSTTEYVFGRLRVTVVDR